MRAFAHLYATLDETTATSEKVAALAAYFRSAPPADAAWTVHFLIGRRPKRVVSTPKLAAWAAEAAGIPRWLFEESHAAVGDLAETITLLLPDTGGSDDRGLSYWVEERLLPLRGQDEDVQHAEMLRAWRELDRRERFVWNKLITGAFRVGVSGGLVERALALATGSLLFLSEPMKLYYSFPFWVKIGCLVPAILLSFAVRRKLTKDEGRAPRLGERLAAIVSIVLWAGVAWGGRWIGFTG